MLTACVRQIDGISAKSIVEDSDFSESSEHRYIAASLDNMAGLNESSFQLAGLKFLPHVFVSLKKVGELLLRPETVNLK